VTSTVFSGPDRRREEERRDRRPDDTPPLRPNDEVPADRAEAPRPATGDEDSERKDRRRVTPAQRLIPGAYDRTTLTYRQPGSIGGAAFGSSGIAAGPNSLDAATIAERELDGGGAVSERRRPIQGGRALANAERMVDVRSPAKNLSSEAPAMIRAPADVDRPLCSLRIADFDRLARREG
jgi:hypothetical protein